MFRTLSTLRLNQRLMSSILPSVATAAAVVICSTSAIAQPVDARINAPEQKLNNPERGGLRLQYERQGAQPGVTIKPGTPTAPALDPRKSIFVTDVDTVSKLTFFDVMDQLRKQSNDPTLTPLRLFQQWWDTAAAAPGTFVGPHCEPILNGFPYRCPRPEAAEATSDPFTNPTGLQGYSAIAYSNRFDLADVQNPGRGCGEQRVVFARNSGRTPPTPPPPAPPPNLNRLLIIFEALVPNPQPHRGLDGCEDIQKFWLSLSDSNMTPAQRGDRLRDFFLNGIPAQNIRPVIHIDSYSNIGGQIRTNQFLNQGGSNGFEWTLREFKIQNLQPGIRIIPATVKTTPDTSLFSGTAPIDLQPHFAARIADELQNLRGGPGGTESNAATIGLNLSRPGDDAFNPFESSENVADRGSVELAFKPTSLLGVYLAAKLDELKKPGGGGTTLTVDNVIQRIQTQTCAGCHQWSNDKPLGGGAGNWPSSLQFVHQSEQDPETVDGVQRFRISETLKSPGFIPARCRIIADFLSADNSLCTNVQ